MSIHSIGLLVRFLFLFIVRRVFGRGVLRTPAVRWTIAVGLAVAFVGYCLLSYSVLRDLIAGEDLLATLLSTLAIVVPLWVLVVFTVIRVLFLRADALMRLTFALPATGRERTIAFTVFESLIVGVALTVVFGAFVIASIAIDGPGLLPPVLVLLVLPALTCYLLLSIGYLTFERLLAALGLSRARGLLIPSVLAIALVVMFQVTTVQTQDFLVATTTGREWMSPQLVYSWLADRYGPLAAVAAGAGVVAIALVTIAVVAPRSYSPMLRHIRLFRPRRLTSRVAVNLLAQVRSFETDIVLLFVAVVTVALVVTGTEAPPFAVLMLTFQGVYAFAGADPIRRMVPKTSGPFGDYLSMVLAQAVVFVAASVPVVAVATIQGIDPSLSAIIIGAGLANIILTTTVGIAFPAENGNPFSVLIGVAVMLVVVGTIALAVSAIELPAVVTIAVVLLLCTTAAILGVTGIARIERHRRHEMAH